MDLTKEQFEYWKSLPETQERYRLIDEQIKNLEKGLGRGMTVHSISADETALTTALLVGEIRGLQYFLEDHDIEFEE